MPEHHLLDLDSLPSAFEPCPECGDVMCQPDPWGEDCDDRARRRQAVATLEDQRRQAHAHHLRVLGDVDQLVQVLRVEAALEAANIQMAEIGLMPQSCRESDAA